MELVYFKFPCDIAPISVTVFPTDAVMAVSGIAVVIVAMMQGMQANRQTIRSINLN